MKITTLMSAAAISAAGLVAAPAAPLAQASAVPQGSFSQTCLASYAVGGRLFSSCRNTSGAFVRSSILLTSCTGMDVANINGLLTCGGTAGRLETSAAAPRPRPPTPTPTPTLSVTLYRDINFVGYSRTYTTAQPNLTASGLNNQISSMRLTGGWQACSQPNYRGQCQSFAGQVRNLNDVGFDNVILSIRPLR